MDQDPATVAVAHVVARSPSCDDILDDTLLRSWRAGDRRAGDHLLRRHYACVDRFFVKRVSEPKELTQRTFVACVESVHRYRECRGFRAYLLGIAHNVLRSHFRGLGGSRSPIPLEGTPIYDQWMTPSEWVLVNEDDALLRSALRHLPVEQQTALQLHIWEDLTAREIAEALGWPEGTVKDRLRRAKRQLKELIKASRDAC